jgi:hypothetical protein
MNRLKTENFNKCFSILEEFIDQSQEDHNKKGMALVALGQLQKITAGTVTGGPQCKGHVR